MGISLGIVGMGQFGVGFAELFMGHPLVDRIALCDMDRRRIAPYAQKESWRAKLRPSDLYDSLEAICRSDIQALAIITQPWLHAPQALAALEAGKHVYSAVPVIELPDGQEILGWCDRLVAAVDRTGLAYMLGETTFYRPETVYCRRRAAEGAFGDFVYSEGEYLHDVDDYWNLRDIFAKRTSGKAAAQLAGQLAAYQARGVKTGPMHYPTHSVSGPLSVMGCRALKVSGRGWADRTGDAFFADSAFSDEVAFFQMSNGSTMRISEFRQVGCPTREAFRIYGTRGSFDHGQWMTNQGASPVPAEQMREPLPQEVARGFAAAAGRDDYLGGHGGSHGYLVHEFVSAVAAGRQPAIDVRTAAQYMACGVAAHQSALRDGEWLTVADW